MQIQSQVRPRPLAVALRVELFGTFLCVIISERHSVIFLGTANVLITVLMFLGTVLQYLWAPSSWFSWS